MKYSAKPRNQTAYTAAIRAHFADVGRHAACRIRKCRRDGACTGPFCSAYPGTETVCLVDSGDLENPGHIGVVPICTLESNDAQLAAMCAYLDATFADAANQFIVPDRAISARIWTSIGGIKG